MPQTRIGPETVDFVAVGPALSVDWPLPVGALSVGASIPALGSVSSGWLAVPGVEIVRVFLVVDGASGEVGVEAALGIDGEFSYGEVGVLPWSDGAPEALSQGLGGRIVRSMRLTFRNLDALDPGVVSALRIVFT